MYVDAALVHVGDLQFRFVELAKVRLRRRRPPAETGDGIVLAADLDDLVVEHVGMKVDDERNVGMFLAHGATHTRADGFRTGRAVGAGSMILHGPPLDLQ